MDRLTLTYAQQSPPDWPIRRSKLWANVKGGFTVSTPTIIPFICSDLKKKCRTCHFYRYSGVKGSNSQWLMSHYIWECARVIIQGHYQFQMACTNLWSWPHLGLEHHYSLWFLCDVVQTFTVFTNLQNRTAAAHEHTFILWNNYGNTLSIPVNLLRILYSEL